MDYSIHAKTLLQLNFTHKHVLFKKWFCEGDVKLKCFFFFERVKLKC